MPTFTIEPGFDSESPSIPMPMASYIHRINDDLVLGVGMYAPYGLGGLYDDSIRYRESMVALVNITPALSLRLSDKLWLGLGLDIGYGQLKYHGSLQLGKVFIDPLYAKSQADGFGIGGRVGLMYHATEKLTLGLCYSTPIKTDLSGKTDLRLFGVEIGSDRFDSSFTFPGRLAAGIAYRPNDEWTVAVDGAYFWYGGANEVNLDFRNLPDIATVKLNWQDNWAVFAGAERKLDENWRVRFGAGWQTAAIPESTSSPITPDVNGWLASFGLGYTKNNWEFNVAFTHAEGERTVGRDLWRNNIAPATTKADIDIISVGFGYRF
jgi:long-chain fatty acid transport protein